MVMATAFHVKVSGVISGIPNSSLGLKQGSYLINSITWISSQNFIVTTLCLLFSLSY